MFRRVLFLIFALLLLPFALSCRHQSRAIDDYGPVGEFALTERNGDTVRDSDLHGKVWIASFVFTRCTGPCPQVSASVARLQSELKDDDVRFVTFTVDPKHDGPKELAEYAEHFQADSRRWLFLTGKQDEIYRQLRNGFHVAVEENEGTARQPGQEVMHSQKLVVVDRRGHIRGYFDGIREPLMDDPERAFEANLESLRQTVAALLREAP
jgi:cytochrome oxidase Cu insertion factor (SCO1/SenC/PrrC family)